MAAGSRPQGGLGGWAPGNLARQLPEGAGYFLPRKSDVIVQLHYHRNGRVEKDLTCMCLYFAKKSAVKQFKGLVIPGRFIYIPRGKERYVVRGSSEVLQY